MVSYQGMHVQELGNNLPQDYQSSVRLTAPGPRSELGSSYYVSGALQLERTVAAEERCHTGVLISP